MRKQTDLERRFENLLSRRETLVRAANKAPYLENQARVSETAAELRVTTNELCVNLKESPDVFANLRFAVAERAELTALVAETAASLGEEGVFSFSRLARRRVKEEARDEDMAATRAREKALSGEVAALRDTIAREKAQHEAWAKEKAAVVASLKAELKTKKGRAGSETRFAKKDVVADSECNARQRAQTLAALRREHEALAAETAREKAAHAEIVDYLRRRESVLSARVATASAEEASAAARSSRSASARGSSAPASVASAGVAVLFAPPNIDASVWRLRATFAARSRSKSVRRASSAALDPLQPSPSPTRVFPRVFFLVKTRGRIGGS